MSTTSVSVLFGALALLYAAGFGACLIDRDWFMTAITGGLSLMCAALALTAAHEAGRGQ